MIHLLLHLLLILSSTCFVVTSATSEEPAENQFLRVRADPDTTCSDAYRKSPTKDTCLEQLDHFLRPCVYCQDKAATYCYNADEAKWAKLFGEKCESGTPSLPSVKEDATAAI